MTVKDTDQKELRRDNHIPPSKKHPKGRREQIVAASGFWHDHGADTLHRCAV